MSINKFKPLPPFKLQVLTNFPFIDADFDALTNWELYCKLVDYINKIIVVNENNLNDNMNSLNESFNNLKNYVDEYFENLDVQEEINNKLDSMALDGTLSALLTSIINSILTTERLSEIVENIWGVTIEEIINNASDYTPIILNGDFITAEKDTVLDSTYNMLVNTTPNAILTMPNLISAINNQISLNVNSKKYAMKSLAYDESVISLWGDSDITLHLPDTLEDGEVIIKYDLRLDIGRCLTFSNFEAFKLSPNKRYFYTGEINCILESGVISDIVDIFNSRIISIIPYISVSSTLPVASSEYEGAITQYIGVSNSTYTKGHFYECISDGGDPATYSWNEINLGGNSNINGVPYEEIYLSRNFFYTDFTQSENLFCRIDSSDTNIFKDIINYLIDNNIDRAIYKITFRDSSYFYGNNFIIAKKPSYSIIDGILPLTWDIIIDPLCFSILGIQGRWTTLIPTDFMFNVTYSNGHASSVQSGVAPGSVHDFTYLTPTSNIYYPMTLDYQPAHKLYVDETVAKYSVVPTASASNLGKIIQYIGASDLTYTKGHFYECVSDSGTPATYSWSEINLGGSANINGTFEELNFGSTYPLEYYSSTNTIRLTSSVFNNNDIKTLLINAINDQINNNIKTRYYIVKATNLNCGFTFFSCTLPDDLTGTKNIMLYIYYDLPIILGSSRFTLAKQTYNRNTDNYGILSATFTDGLVSGYSFSNSGVSTSCPLLDVSNTTSFTPTSNYNPVHKLYVDSFYTTITGYDGAKTQVLKNINGTLTWVDET